MTSFQAYAIGGRGGERGTDPAKGHNISFYVGYKDDPGGSFQAEVFHAL